MPDQPPVGLKYEDLRRKCLEALRQGAGGRQPKWVGFLASFLGLRKVAGSTRQVFPVL
jgi:hypothetical protein